MNLQSLLTALQTFVDSVPPPSPFTDGLLFGTLLGMVLGCLIMGRHALGVFLRRSLRAMMLLAPAVLACLLWGAWIGILAAKGVVR